MPTSFLPLRRSLLALAFALGAIGAAPTFAHASTGCDAVNAGGYNVTNANINIVGTISGFAVGDQITLVYSSPQGGNLILIGSVPLLFAPVTPAPSTTAYTVTGNNGDTTIQVYFSPSDSTAVITVSATCVAAAAPGPSGAAAAQAVTKGFLASRINGILLNDPNSTSLLNRGTGSHGTTTTAALGNGGTSVASNGFGTFGSAMALGAGLGRATTTGFGSNGLPDEDSGTTGSRPIEFRTSLSQMTRDAASARMEKERMALGYSNGLRPSYERASPYDIWVEGRYSAFNDDAASLARDGHVGVLYVGGDYRVAENMIVGALVQFDWSKDASDVLQSSVDGNGWMAGPYLSMRVHDNIYLDLRAAWGRSSNDLALGATTGSFDTTRWLVKGRLAGNWLFDCWRLTPSAELAYITEDQDAFTNSAATLVPSQSVSLGRLTFGPEIGYRFQHTEHMVVEPFASIKGVWDFDNPNVAIIDGFVVGPGDFWGRLEGGLMVVTEDGWQMRAAASYDGLGASDYSGYTLQGTLNVPLN